ncbi:hypothetical protein CEP54_012558 [Fusarium duplospermum]|uniref:Uncharacterized protein n=1 Tax=Fusarium duplospermum TaxID=1325734 RepID=A0A428P8A0_9HYPO|nr:hypothetical protein CEP54_012558 [Fusarium duplospermum]
MPDNDNGSTRPESSNQTSECPKNERPVPEKTKSTPQEEAKTQDEPSPKAGEDPAKAEQYAEFYAWVEWFKVNRTAAWNEWHRRFDALMESELGDIAQSTQEDKQGTSNYIPFFSHFPQTDHRRQRVQIILPRLQKPPNLSRKTPKKTFRMTKKTAVIATRQVPE